MVTKQLGKSKTILLGLLAGVFTVFLSAVNAVPAQAATTIDMSWVSATSVRFGGSALSSPVTVNGNLESNVFGAPPGTQTFMASTGGPVQMSFGCRVTMIFNIYANTGGSMDFTRGEIIFTTSAPSTCSQDTLRANINGLVHDPKTGTANISLLNVPISGVENRGPAGGTDSPAQQIVNVTAGMGPASDYNDIPQTDTFMLCEAKGDYANNIDALMRDCLAQRPEALSAPAITSGNLQNFANGRGPNGSDEKGWTGQFTNVKAGIYVVCSANFKACKLFQKNAGTVADVYVIYGSTTGSTIPGTPPGQGQGDEKVCTTGDGLAGALAWVLCPAVQLIASATNFFENNIIIPFMTVSPLTTHPDNPIYILWQNIRNVANIGFIVFFLIVIFSQSTGFGISNLGIKRILPKMAIVVLGVNLSYFIVAFIIDAFNIFGAGISQLVTAALQQANTTQLNTGTSAGPVRSIFTLGGAALLAIVLSGGSAIGWFFSFLLLALLVVVVVVIVLVVRQMAIIMLVIVAPVAILMYMLPNTEGYFTKWRKTLIQLLMMYPMIVLLFAAGKIFGIILQQPDFKIAGEGVSDDVAQAVRVILQFVVYVVPLVFLPATFAASGALMGRAYGLLHNARTAGLARKGGSAFNENVVRPRRQEAQMRAARRGGAIGWAAGYGARRDFKREQRERELSRARSEYLSSETLREGSGLAASAAGIGGEAGRTRAAAHAASAAARGRDEDLQAEMALLEAKMRELGVDQKTFASAAGKYLEDPTKAANQVITGANGKTFNFKQNEAQFQRALLNSAASQGEIKAIEAARLNSSIDQTMVDDIIRRNDGKLKEKGGYHLATNFNLANGRGGLDTSSQAGLQAARTQMLQQRMITISETGANSIAGMKAGLLADTADAINRVNAGPPPATASQEEKDAYDAAFTAFNAMAPEARQKLFDRIDEIKNNSNTLNRSEGADSIRKIHAVMSSGGGGVVNPLTGGGYTHS